MAEYVVVQDNILVHLFLYGKTKARDLGRFAPGQSSVVLTELRRRGFIKETPIDGFQGWEITEAGDKQLFDRF